MAFLAKLQRIMEGFGFPIRHAAKTDLTGHRCTDGAIVFCE